jgi:hypothetical protein
LVAQFFAIGVGAHVSAVFAVFAAAYALTDVLHFALFLQSRSVADNYS